jgi:hypothetical protein
MMEEHLKETYKDIVVVRFDPWLVSGSNDLISQFMAELTFAVNDKAKSTNSLKQIGVQLANYGSMLSPGINLIAPGLGSAVQGGFKAATKMLTTEGSLVSVRAKLVTLLSAVTVPIVVLIDELDRVDDAEILTVAQLVRAVVDFPRVSFALAYDVDRVVQALGRSSPERGRAYLEKIVQLQIPLPIQMPMERASILDSEIERMNLRDHSGAILDTKSPSYTNIVSILNDGFLDTPRDVKRLCGTFHALYGMVGNEVSWVELLAYCALLSKYPNLIERIRRDPERIVYNTIDGREIQRRSTSSQEANAEWVTNTIDSTSASGARQLLIRLFPILDRTANLGTPLPNALGFRRPLLTVLRLGLIPGDFSRDECSGILNLDRDSAREKLFELSDGGTITAFIDRLDGVASDREEVDIQFWLAVSDFLTKPNSDVIIQFPVQRNILSEMVGIITRSSGRNIKLRNGFSSLLSQLVSEGELSMTSALVRSHFFAHGMYGYQQQEDREWFIDRSKTDELSKILLPLITDNLQSGTLLSKLYSLESIYLANAMDRSNTNIKKSINDFISTPEGVDTLTLIWFGGGYKSSKNFIEQFCSVPNYINAIKSRKMSIKDSERPLIEALRSAEIALGAR